MSRWRWPGEYVVLCRITAGEVDRIVKKRVPWSEVVWC